MTRSKGENLRKRNQHKRGGFIPTVYEPRKCLRCHEMFDSTGPGNRICSECKKTVSNYVRRFSVRRMNSGSGPVERT